ncbi:sugar transferase [Sphingomonas sp. SRS2]|uniref:sugar transferase n=1 Tax=Sphingomonas sp. SRS2 TaxID=133190 RepID=UPI0006184EE8|nr:sugar transferase [Sphingomonas sp. SRS2]KKC25698.1 sugar transferase [Sphingomonas sp. SRS2]
MQRFLDIFLAVIALLLFAPILIPVMIILRLTGEGEIFYRQERVGRAGSPFMVYKFATMLKNSPSLGTGTVTLKNDPRVLPLGRMLRKTKLNELPQLLNILNGTMSIIGPRPQTRRCFDAYPLNSQHAIGTVPPGLSGIGSIVFRDEEEIMHASIDPEYFYDHVIMPYKGLLEQWYVEHRTIKTYIISIILTILTVFFPRSGFIWRIFPTLPKPPVELLEKINGCGPGA